MSEYADSDVQIVLNDFLMHNNSWNKPTLTPLMGGRSGAEIYTFEQNNQKYVLRMFPVMEERASKAKESEITTQVAKFGFAPKVFYVDPKYRGMVIEFLPGHTLLSSEAKKAKNIKKFASLLNKLHNINITK